MGSVIDDNSYSINNQITSGSRSSILLSHVEFTRNEDEDDSMSAKCLQTKYNVLTNDNKYILNKNNLNNNELVIKMNVQIIGQNNNRTIHSNLMNGNNSDNTSEGIPVPKHVVFARERVLLEWKEPHKIGAGLSNMGNTCFLNSVLQCLTYCPPLVNYLLNTEDHNQNKCNPNFCMTCEMTRHIRMARNHCGDVIKPINICRRLKSIAKHFQFGRQEDAHEFLRYVVDNMWKSCLHNHDIQGLKLDPLSKETTAINQIFGGYHRSQVICLQCKAKSNTYDYFMDFMLDIKNTGSLEKALEKFVAPEILQQEDAYKCTRCKRKVLAKKQFTVHKAPNVATFQFKRFDYNRIFGGKITKPVTYPERLNLRPYMSDNKGPPINYKLNSVLVHLGPTCNSGHYFCYVRNSNNIWYLMDDSRVIQVNQHQVLSQPAYVLFYVRIDNDFHKPNPVKNFISQTTPNGIKLSNISSPEKTFRNQKLNNFSSNANIGFTSAQNHSKLNSPNITLKGVQSTHSTQSDAIKHNINIKRKQNNCESNERKGLVPYAYDSSDEDNSPKPTAQMNGSLNSNCDNNISNKNNNNNRLSLSENNSNETEKSSPKVEKVDNNWTKLKTNSNQNIQNIPNSNPKPKININIKPNNTSDSGSCVPLAPITLKVKATTSSWHVVDTVHRSPSIASNSSTNSVNSTTAEWTVSECLSDCNASKHSKHKHRNKANRCSAVVNGNVSQVLNTNHKIPQTGQQNNEIDVKPNTDLTNHSLNNSEELIHSNKSDLRDNSLKKSETKCEKNSLISNYLNSSEGNEAKFKEKSIESNSSAHLKDHFDRRSVSSHRSSNDSTRDTKTKSKSHDRSQSRSVNSDDDKSTGSLRHEKRKHKRKHKLDSNESRNTSDSDVCEKKTKIKHKKNKKMKKKKHKRRQSSDSDSEESDDNQLQWIERTKETVERERDNPLNKTETIVKQWNEDIKDLSNINKKRNFDEIKDKTEESVERKQLFISNGNNDVVNGLLKTTIRGFGDKVNSWTGGTSSLDTALNDEKRLTNGSIDDYDEEYDRGKTKKVKTNKNEKYFNSNHNPFQKISSQKYRFNGSLDYRNDKHFESKYNHKPWKAYHN